MKKTKLFVMLAGVILGMAFFSPAFAQEATADNEAAIDNDSEQKNGVVVSTVDINDAKIVSQDNNNIKLSFDLSNQEQNQPDVRYAVKLFKMENEKQIIVDEYIYPEVINLNENQIVKKEIVYNAPAYLNGEFEVWIIANNQNGLNLAISFLGGITLTGDSQYAEILFDSCYLQVEGGESRYTLGHGVDIKNEENLIATCDIINHYSADIDITPQIETFWRTGLGSKAITNQQKQSNFSIKAQEKKQFSLTLPKPQIPQAYDAQLQLKNAQGQIISNKVNFHYVLKGLSATIQNLRLDKNYYQRGEAAKISFFWSGPADNFFESRTGKTNSGKLFTEISIKDKDGQDCIEKTKKELDPSVATPELIFPITRECLNPQAAVNIQDDKGTFLDKKDYNLVSENVPVKEAKQSPILLYAIILTIILLGISSIAIFVKRKNNLGSIVFVLLTFGMLGISGGGIRAESGTAFNYGVRAQYATDAYVAHNMTITPDLNKTIYAPGESIVSSIAVQNTGCDNSWFDYNLKIVLKSGSTKNRSFGTVINDNTKLMYYTAAAPTTPGNYVATFSFIDNRCSSGGVCLGTLGSSSSSPFATPDGLYLINKASKIGYTVWDTYQAFLDNGLTPFQHYNMFGKTPGCTSGFCENISPCKASCDGRASLIFVSVPYKVVAPIDTTPSFSCTGINPPFGASWCPGSFTGLSLNFPWHSVASCTGAKCEYTVPTATCTDGIQNGTETGVDCGGSCSACAPSPLNCPSPWPGEPAIPNGGSVIAYLIPETKSIFYCEKVKQIRVCTNGVLSGTAQDKACDVTTVVPPICPTCPTCPMQSCGWQEVSPN